MNDLAKKAKNAYQKSWRARNKDKVKAYQEVYWTKKAEQPQDSTEANERGGYGEARARG